MNIFERESFFQANLITAFKLGIYDLYFKVYILEHVSYIIGFSIPFDDFPTLVGNWKRRGCVSQTFLIPHCKLYALRLEGDMYYRRELS